MSGRTYSTIRSATNSRAARIAESQIARNTAVQNLSGSFRTRKGSRLRDRYIAPIASGSAHSDQISRDKSVLLCQHLKRNHPNAQVLIKRKGEIVAGARPKLNLLGGSQQWQENALAYLKKWMTRKNTAAWCTEIVPFDHEGVMNLFQFASRVPEMWMTEGDGILLLLENGSTQWIEGLRIRNRNGGMDTDTCVGGVELSEDGRVLGYHVAQWEQGGQRLSNRFEFIHADECLYIGNPALRESGQRRMMPRLDAVINKLDDLDRYETSVDKASEMAAMMATYIVRNDNQAPSIKDGINNTLRTASGDTGSQTAQERAQFKAEPGMVFELGPNETINSVTPGQPSTNFESKVYTTLQGICSNAGLPLELAFYRFTNNYAASRSAISAAWMGIRDEQASLVDDLLHPLTHWRLAMAIRNGEIPYVDGWDRMRFDMPGQPSLDYGKDVDAVVKAIAGSVSTRGKGLDRLGEGTHGEFMDEREVELVREEAAGIQTVQPAAITITKNEDDGGQNGNQNGNE